MLLCICICLHQYNRDGSNHPMGVVNIEILKRHLWFPLPNSDSFEQTINPSVWNVNGERQLNTLQPKDETLARAGEYGTF